MGWGVDGQGGDGAGCRQCRGLAVPAEPRSAPAAVPGLPPPSPGPSPRCSRRLRPFPACPGAAPVRGWRWRGTGTPRGSGAGQGPHPGSAAPAFCDSRDSFALNAEARLGIFGFPRGGWLSAGDPHGAGYPRAPGTPSTPKFRALGVTQSPRSPR